MSPIVRDYINECAFKNGWIIADQTVYDIECNWFLSYVKPKDRYDENPDEIRFIVKGSTIVYKKIMVREHENEPVYVKKSTPIQRISLFNPNSLEEIKTLFV